MSKFGVEDLDFPAQIPDNKPIHHLWDELDCRLGAGPYRPVPNLTLALVDEWELKIPVARFQNLVESLPCRFEIVIAVM